MDKNSLPFTNVVMNRLTQKKRNGQQLIRPLWSFNVKPVSTLAMKRALLSQLCTYKYYLLAPLILSLLYLFVVRIVHNFYVLNFILIQPENVTKLLFNKKVVVEQITKKKRRSFFSCNRSRHNSLNIVELWIIGISRTLITCS